MKKKDDPQDSLFFLPQNLTNHIKFAPANLWLHKRRQS
jgi:hypothetical protein